MSALGNFFASIIADDRTTAASLAERMKIAPSMMSRFMNDPHPSCNRETLEQMVTRISDDARVQAGLQAAYLQDQRVGESAPLVAIAVKGRRVAEDSPDYVADPARQLLKAVQDLDLPARSVRALRLIIMACAKSKRFSRSMHDLADIAEHDILPKAGD